MLTAMKLKRVQEIENNVTLPEKNWFVKRFNPDTLLMTYYTKRRLNHIYLAGAEIPKFLYKHGVIASYAYLKEMMVMFTKTFNVIEGPKGEPVFQERMIPFKFEDIDFTRSQVITFCAEYEFEKMHSIINKAFDFFEGGLKRMVSMCLISIFSLCSCYSYKPLQKPEKTVFTGPEMKAMLAKDSTITFTKKPRFHYFYH